MAIIDNFAKKKGRGVARLVRVDAERATAEERVRDEDDNQTWVVRDTHTIAHLNDLIAAATASRDAFVAEYQPQLRKLNKAISNLNDIKTEMETQLKNG